MTRGLKGVKEGQVTGEGKTVRVAIAHGLGNVETVLDKVREALASGQEPLTILWR